MTFVSLGECRSQKALHRHRRERLSQESSAGSFVNFAAIEEDGEAAPDVRVVGYCGRICGHATVGGQTTRQSLSPTQDNEGGCPINDLATEQGWNAEGEML